MMGSQIPEDDLTHLAPYSSKRDASKLPQTRQRGPRLSEAILQHGIEARNGEVFKLVFESANSDWQQSVTLVTDKEVRLGTKIFKRGVIVHYDPSRSEFLFEARTREGMLWVWNSWHYRDAQGSLHTASQLNYAGMIVEKLSTGFRYRCNEGRDDDDYDDLVFRIERKGMGRFGSHKEAQEFLRS